MLFPFTYLNTVKPDIYTITVLYYNNFSYEITNGSYYRKYEKLFSRVSRFQMHN